MKIVGIDPGLSGGIAIMDEVNLVTHAMPTVSVGKKNAICLPVLRGMLVSANPQCVYIEKVSAMPKQGVTSMFNFGMGYGMIQGMCAALKIPYEFVTPQEWKKTVLAGRPSGSEAEYAGQRWPDHNWLETARCKKWHDGMIDAALIAEYGMRKTRGQNVVQRPA
jgi:crossover junction endodeoxyribonuclease RuvC